MNALPYSASASLHDRSIGTIDHDYTARAGIGRDQSLPTTALLNRSAEKTGTDEPAYAPYALSRSSPADSRVQKSPGVRGPCGRVQSVIKY
jgi:hypothetical protein